MTGTPAVVLLSGGLDSATTAAVARRDGHDVHALSFDYGQRHDYELHAARMVAEHLDVSDYRVMKVDLAAFGGSALTDHAIPVPTTSGPGIPVTYVPARNTVFLSYALAYAEVVGATDVYLGVNAVDYSGYPDCRPEYIAAFEAMANLATRAGVEGQRLAIHAPLIDMTKPDIIRLGLSLGVNYGLTWSCYDPQPSWDFSDPTPDPCGRCDSCRIRAAAFAEVGIRDPVV